MENGSAISKRKRGAVSFESLVTPNFEELARQFPDFGRAYRQVIAEQAVHKGPLTAFVTQDFSIGLAKALLHVHWGLALTHLPDHHLCPPIPNRFFYVNWIQQEILPSIRHFDCERSYCRVGLDIGTGATCIYPLLFVATSEYHMIATDVDADAIQLATANVQSNHLESHIQVLQVPPSDRQCTDGGLRLFPIGPLRQSVALQPNTAIDFCMTNPPFFDDSVSVERTNPRVGDGRDRTAMTASEGSYPGGEVAFVTDVIVDGLALLDGVSRAPIWSSCMCGKKASLLQLHNLLTHVLGPSHVRTTEFGPGHLTRWFLAWTLEQPKARSELAIRINWSFHVSVDSSATQPVELMIKERFVQYCASFPGTELAVSVSADDSERRYLRIYEVTPHPNDSNLPEPFQSLLSLDRRNQFLPPEGHFVLDVRMQGQTARVKLGLEAFCHSSYGKEIVDKIKLQLEGEICRTNRRWRRKLKREQDENMDE